MTRSTPKSVGQPAHYCAPRLNEGYEVDAVRRGIAQRAGLLRAADGPRTGELRGYIDLVSETCIVGWAQNADHPEAPVCLDIYAGGRLIGQALANRYREDLKRPVLAAAATASRSRRRLDCFRLRHGARCAARSTARRLNSPDVHYSGSQSRKKSARRRPPDVRFGSKAELVAYPKARLLYLRRRT